MRIFCFLATMLGFVLLVSCSSVKTVYISNHLGTPVLIRVDTLMIAHEARPFIDSLQNAVVSRRLIINYGKGKWLKRDKAVLEEFWQRVKFFTPPGTKEVEVKGRSRIRYIRLGVEELWINIRR